LLFLVLKRTTKAFWLSALVAALFAWHPLRVESVAWVAERKDVLSTFFWMLSLWAYVGYVEALKATATVRHKFYALALVSFVLGLLSKPMILTLPCALVLLDYWPLARFQLATSRDWHRLILEKVPFFALAAGSAVMTTIAADKGGALASTRFVRLSTRIETALVGYPSYLGKLLWPTRLSVIYPLASQLPTLEICLAAVLLAAVTIAAVRLRSTRPYILVGWLWFLGILFPVMGLMQAGGQSIADRFTYVPSIGFFILTCWMVNDLTREWNDRPVFLSGLAGVILAACVLQTAHQLKYWRNSGTLFQHALALNPDNFLAHCSYGCYLRDLGQLEPAEAQCRRSLEVAPNYVMGYIYLAGILEMESRSDQAISVLQAGLKVRPDFPDARCELAKLLFARNLYQDAEAELQEGLKLDPDDAQLHLYLGYELARQGNHSGADEQFAAGIRLDPSDPAGHFQWALNLAAQHKMPDAIVHYRAALRLQPDLPNALNNLAWLLSTSPDPNIRDGPEAVLLAKRACILTQTNDPVKIETLATAFASAGDFGQAVKWAQTATTVALAHGQTNIADQSMALQKLFRSHKPYYEYQ
jgi:Flp pilus assembly protein TadD